MPMALTMAEVKEGPRSCREPGGGPAVWQHDVRSSALGGFMPHCVRACQAWRVASTGPCNLCTPPCPSKCGTHPDQLGRQVWANGPHHIRCQLQAHVCHQIGRHLRTKALGGVRRVGKGTPATQGQGTVVSVWRPGEAAVCRASLGVPAWQAPAGPPMCMQAGAAGQGGCQPGARTRTMSAVRWAPKACTRSPVKAGPKPSCGA